MTIYSLDVLLFLFGISLLFHKHCTGGHNISNDTCVGTYSEGNTALNVSQGIFVKKNNQDTFKLEMEYWCGSREIWIGIPGLLNAASVISDRFPNVSVFDHYL